MTAFVIKLIDHRRIVLLIGIIITGFWASQLMHLGIDGSFTSVLPADDPDFQFSRTVEQEFGSSDEIIVLIRSKEGIFSRDAVELIQKLGSELSSLEEIDGGRLISMLTISAFSSPDGTGADWEDSLAELELFMKNDPLASGTLVNEEATATMITAPVTGEIGLSDRGLRNFVKKAYEIRDRYQPEYPGLEIRMSGHPVVNAEIMDKMANDLYVLFPIAVLAVAAMLLYILRSVRGMIIPLLITLMAVIWTLGLKGLIRSPLTITETVIPVILISISCADGIHIVSEAFHFMHHGMNSRDAIIRTVNDLWKPVVLTSLTTALGFASFIFSSGSSLRNMGLFLSFGVIAAMIFSLFFIPVLFSWYKPLKLHKDRKHYRTQYKLLRRIEHITEFFLKHRVKIIIISAGFLVLSAGGIMNINTDTDEIRYFRKDNEIRQTAELIEDEMGGLSILQIVLEGEAGIFREMSVLQDMAAFSAILEKRGEVSTTVSLADTISYLFYTMRGRDPDFFIIPDNRIFVQRLLSILSSPDDERSSMLAGYVNEDFSRARILVRINDSNTRVMEKLLDEIKPELDIFSEAGISARFAGDYTRLTNGRIIVKSQILSLGITLGIILLVLSIIYRSFIRGLIVALPVIIAVLFNFAVMWMFRVSLNPATAIISAVGLGVGIDYSIHIFSRFRLIHKRGDNLHVSLINAVTESARGILSNAFSVGMGFLILLFSIYRIINDMGWIIALTMLTTSLSSLILLPCMLSFIKDKPLPSRQI